MPVLKVLDPHEHAWLGGDFEVWLDPDGHITDGICLGLARSREEALYGALEELKRHLHEVEALIKLGRHNVEV